MKKEAQHVRMTDSRNTAHVECESQSGTGTNRGDWTISESLRQYLSYILGTHEINGLQKTATLDTAHLLCHVLL